MTNRGWHIAGDNDFLEPAHFGQEWEIYNPQYDFNVSDLDEYTYQNEGHSVYTIQLFELIESGVFDWEREELNWKDSAYDDAQFERVCLYFNSKYLYREISILPIKEWFNALKTKLVFELMPKYNYLYSRLEDGLEPLANENEYFKNRRIESEYPQTLLSENADYISSGTDEEYQRIKEDNITDSFNKFASEFRSIDQMLVEELEPLFISMYSSYINGI